MYFAAMLIPISGVRASCDMLNAYSKSKLQQRPKDLKVAIIHEDGPYGVGVAKGNEERCTKHGIQIVTRRATPQQPPEAIGTRD